MRWTVLLLAMALSQLSSAPERAIVSAVDAGNAAALALLETSVNINSGTHNFAGVRAVGDLFRKEFDALGFKTTWVDGSGFKRAGHLIADHPGQGTAHHPHRPSRHGLRARQPVPEVQQDRREDGDRPRRDRHEGGRRHHHRRAQGAQGRRRARRHERDRRHDRRRGGFRRSAGRGARRAGRRREGGAVRAGVRGRPRRSALRGDRPPRHFVVEAARSKGRPGTRRRSSGRSSATAPTTSWRGSSTASARSSPARSTSPSIPASCSAGRPSRSTRC